MIGNYQSETMPPEAPPRIQAVLIGASAGAVEALFVLLPALPANFPVPLMVVVHLPRDKESVLPNLYRARCRLEVKEAEDKELARPGVAYFAPPDYHLLVEPDRRLSLSSDEPVRYSRPSIDVLFESAAEAYGEGVLGVILTGANDDGSAGLRAVCAAGGTAVVQDPATAQAPQMPRAALAACPEARVLRLEQIADYLREAVGAGAAP